jgi:hypothetical protein
LKFFHPCRIPRKATDAPVWLGCALWPGNTPGLEAIRLQIYDPNAPAHYREWFVSGSENWYVVTSWDGYLFENNDSTRPVRVGGNDVVMRAWVTFNTTFDGEPLLPQDFETQPFVEPRLMILSPNKAAFENYRFVFNEKNIYLKPEDNPEPGYCEFRVSGATNFENQTADPSDAMDTGRNEWFYLDPGNRIGAYGMLRGFSLHHSAAQYHRFWFQDPDPDSPDG